MKIYIVMREGSPGCCDEASCSVEAYPLRAYTDKQAAINFCELSREADWEEIELDPADD